MYISFSELNDAIITYSNYNRGTESVFDIIKTIVNSLIQLVKSVYNAIIGIFNKIKTFFSIHLSETISNNKILKKHINDPNYKEKLMNSKINTIKYKDLVDYTYTFIDTANYLINNINLTDLNVQIDSYIDLKKDDNGVYLKPTIFPLTESFYTQKLKINLELLGIKTKIINTEKSNDDNVITKLDISIVDLLQGQEKTLYDLGYDIKSFTNTIDNSYKKCQYISDTIKNYKNFFNSTLKKLEKFKQKNLSSTPDEDISNPNHKVNRIRLLIENLTVSISLYSRLLVINTKIIYTFSTISSILTN